MRRTRAFWPIVTVLIAALIVVISFAVVTCLWNVSRGAIALGQFYPSPDGQLCAVEGFVRPNLLFWAVFEEGSGRTIFLESCRGCSVNLGGWLDQKMLLLCRFSFSQCSHTAGIFIHSLQSNSTKKIAICPVTLLKPLHSRRAILIQSGKNICLLSPQGRLGKVKLRGRLLSGRIREDGKFEVIFSRRVSNSLFQTFLYTEGQGSRTVSLPRGGKFVVCSVSPQHNYSVKVEGRYVWIYHIGPSGYSLYRCLNLPESVRFPIWSPTGSYLVLSGSSHAWLVDVRRKAWRALWRLGKDFNQVHWVAWMPNEQEVVVAESGKLWLFKLKDRTKHKLWNPPVSLLLWQSAKAGISTVLEKGKTQ